MNRIRSIQFRRGIAVCVILLAEACSFKFEVASSRTTLENQIVGSYQELDSDYIATASVRGVDPSGKKISADATSDSKQRAVAAKQNMEFNRDDLDELKDEQLIGESKDGLVVTLPSGVGKADAMTGERRKFADVLVAEENHDRAIIWKRIIEQSPHLDSNNNKAVRDEFAKTQRESLKSGHWFQNQTGEWSQK